MNQTDRHEKWVESLPAHLLRRLSAAEDAELTAHLAHCEDCREELRLADRLQTYFKRQSVADAVLEQWLHTQQESATDDPQREQRNFERLWQRIEPTTATEKPDVATLVANSATAAAPPKVMRYRWLSAAAAVLVLLVAAGAWREHWVTPSYRTLANNTDQTHCGALRVRFVDNLAASDLQYLLHSVDAQIVAGPTPHGVYTLRAPQPGAALQRLHLHPAVLLAEPTGC